MTDRGIYIKRCKRCNQELPANYVSHRGVCYDCARLAILRAHRQIRARKGEIYERYRRNRLAALERMRESKKASE